MATISDTLTMGIVLAVILGSLFFYLYTRLLQVEKRISLTENILLDLKMATENTLLMMGSGSSNRFMDGNSDNDNEQTEHVEATTDAQPLQEQEVEELKEEDKELEKQRELKKQRKLEKHKQKEAHITTKHQNNTRQTKQTTQPNTQNQQIS